MAFVNRATKSLAVKIAYYGPGLSGKTTNLRYLYFKLDPVSRGDLICLETENERTFFFDLLPIRGGMIDDFETHFQLLTVAGQVFYEASRKSVLKGADGIVFVADSQIPLLDANLESFDELRTNLMEKNIDLNFIPLVFQYNKRDFDNLIPVETFNNLLNPQGLPYVETSAINGVGVIHTLREIVKLTISSVKERYFGEEEKKEEEPEVEERPVEVKEEKAEKKEEVDFGVSKEVSPVKLTKIKVKSQEDIERELDKLAREYTGKSKK